MRIRHLIFGVIAMGAAACQAKGAHTYCESLRVQNADYVACKFDPRIDTIRLHLKDAQNEVYGDFKRLQNSLSKTDQSLQFAMNGGMYHRNREPVGLYIEDGKRLQTLSTKPGEGNFHMLPNGVFWTSRIGGTTQAQVGTAKAYQDAAQENISYATQSGPMLVIDGALHPRFIEGSESRKIRNGVGMSEDGMLTFVISDTPVNFYDFASLFRDRLGARQALYLDGTISRLYAKGLRRNDGGLPMGPIISVTVPYAKKDAS